MTSFTAEMLHFGLRQRLDGLQCLILILAATVATAVAPQDSFKGKCWSLCLAWWWSGNWSERCFTDMLQWSQISRWPGVSGVIIALLSFSSSSPPHHHPHHRDHAPKCAQCFILSNISFTPLVRSTLPPKHNKTTWKPTEVKYSLSPSSSDQLLEQHLSDMAPMTAPYRSLSTPHAGHRGFIGSKLRSMGVGWGTLISCHEKTRESLNVSFYRRNGSFACKMKTCFSFLFFETWMVKQMLAINLLFNRNPCLGTVYVPFASITCRLLVVMIRLVPLQVGKSHKGLPCRSFCLRGLNPKAIGKHGSKMTMCHLPNSIWDFKHWIKRVNMESPYPSSVQHHISS